jgi:hypothetical protein
VAVTIAAVQAQVRPASRPGADPVVDLLRELVEQVKGLRADLSRDRRPSLTLTRADRALLARLLPAIGGALGSDLFTARELLKHDSAALRLVTVGLNAKQLGRLLKRGEGHVIDGYLIQREGLELHAVLWRVVRVPAFSTVENLSVPPRDPRGVVE